MNILRACLRAVLLILSILPGCVTAAEALSAADWSGIRAEYERHRHEAISGINGYAARNPEQCWRTEFDGRGFLVQPDAGGWSWGMELVSYGYAGHECAVIGLPQVTASGGRVAYAWDDAVEEWFVNDTRGLEHGFTLQSRPPGADGRLMMKLAVRGSLVAQVQKGGRGVSFTGEGGAAALTYGGLTVFDAEGRSVPAHFMAGGKEAELIIEDSVATYPLTIDPVAQQAYLKASNSAAGDVFGYSVAVSGDTAVIGAPLEDSIGVHSGAVYVFFRSGGVWSQQAMLKASNAEANDQLGWSVAISGNTIVAGTPWEDSNGTQSDNTITDSGAAYVFFRSGNSWTQQAYLKASNRETLDGFGATVAVSGDTVVVGAPQESSGDTGPQSNQADNSAPQAGAAYVFVRTGTVWSQQSYLKSSNTAAGDIFGWSVAASGETVLIGAHSEDSDATGVNHPTGQASNSALESGAAYVFIRSGTTWTQQAYLKASNTAADDRFGFAVALSGETAVVGSRWESGVAAKSGAAYVFIRSGTAWTQQAYLKASNPGVNDYFSNSLAISGDLIAIGSPYEASSATGVNGNQSDDSVAGAGAVYLFGRSGTVWSQQAYLKASNTGAGDGFGWAVAISGTTTLSGAWLEAGGAAGINGNQNDDSAPATGAGYVFIKTGTVWSQQAYVKASNSSANDQFGWSVAISGDTAVIGAPQESSSATGVNGNQADNSAFKAGAAYVFVRSGGVWSQQAYLKASNAEALDFFGWSVAVSGDIVIVGAPEEDSAAFGVNPVNGQTSNAKPSSGAAYIFTRSGTTWSQQAYVKSFNPGSTQRFGWSMAASGETVVIGAYNEASPATGVNNPVGAGNTGAPGAGAAYVFVRNGGLWSQQAWLKASNTEADDLFGQSVAISGDTIVVGANREDSNATGVNGDQINNLALTSGAAFIFQRSGTSWTQSAYLKASNTGAADEFGWAVAVSGNKVVVGAIKEDSNATGINGNGADNSSAASGAAYAFVNDGTGWVPDAYLKASNTGDGDQFGWSVAIDGSNAVIGANYESGNATGLNGDQSNNSAPTAGAVYHFYRERINWYQRTYIKASNTGSGDNFGGAVAISGTSVLVGAAGEDSAARGVNGNQNDNSSLESGAAYVFDLGALPGLELWRITWFNTLYETGSAANAADPDGDNIPNLLEFAMGRNPLLREPPPDLVKNGALLEFTFPRAKCALGEIAFSVEWSDLLAPAVWSTTGATTSILSDNGTVEQVKVTLPAGTGRRFVRLRVTVF